MGRPGYPESMKTPEDNLAILDWKLRANTVRMTSGCLEWTGAKMHSGHGAVRGLYRNMLTHRAAWLLSHGSLDEDICVCHTCDNPCCCNVDHLFLGTRAENLADMRRKDRQRDYVNCKGAHPGEKNHNAKLTSQDVIDIRNAVGTQMALAKIFGVSREHIRDIRLGKRWRHLSGSNGK